MYLDSGSMKRVSFVDKPSYKFTMKQLSFKLGLVDLLGPEHHGLLVLTRNSCSHVGHGQTVWILSAFPTAITWARE